MTRALAASVVAALLLASSCSGDDDEAADDSAPTSEATNVESSTTVSTTTVAPSNSPPTTRATTLVPSTLGTSTTVTTVTTETSVAPSTDPPSTVVGSDFSPVPAAPPPDEPVHETAPSATDLAVSQTCDPASPDSPAVTLTWRPLAAGGQLVAVAVLPDGFETDRYTVTDVLPADQATYGLSPVEPGGVYRWRVLTRSGDGWVASDIAEFIGPTCIIDAPSSP